MSSEGAGVEAMLYVAGVEECTCGQVYMWGDNVYGQLGQGDSTARFNPTLVQELNGNKFSKVLFTLTFYGTYGQ